MKKQNYGSNANTLPTGTLYIVATPIGNLSDITLRAIETLKKVDIIAAEDTRQSLGLLKTYNIEKPLIALHEHNEREMSKKLIKDLSLGKSIALISDAGTPLISDPGYRLILAAQENNILIVPIPGPSALIAALSASGLPADRFAFEGFLPVKKGQRQKKLELLAQESRTLIFYEAPHRLLASLQAMLVIFGETREAVLARELSKTFETIRRAPLKTLFDWVKSDTDQQRGEMVILIKGWKPEALHLAHIIKPEDAESNPSLALSVDPIRILKILLTELPISQAASLAAKITKIPKRKLYELALKL